MTRITGILFIGLLLLSFVFPPCTFSRHDLQYLWPLSFRAGLSASFGEFRSTHFHMGIDLKTYGKTGYPVQAVADGVIFRIKVQRRGYGNAVYIRHSNGYSSVYAHLERFENGKLGLQTHVNKIKKKKGYYPGDIFLNIPVEKGQVIAYTGESGSGLPHLHFELRNNNQEALNPFTCGMFQEDNAPPVPVSLGFHPSGSGLNLIDGSPYPAEIQFQKQGNGSYRAVKTPVIAGDCLLKLNTYDTIGAGNRCGIYSIKVVCGDNQLYHSSLDRVSYSNYKQIGLFYDPGLSGFNPTRYTYNLFKKKALTVPVIKQSVGDGLRTSIQAYPVQKNYDFEIADATGNVSAATVTVVHDSSPVIVRALTKKTQIKNGRENQFVIIDPDGVATLEPGKVYLELEYSSDWGKSWSYLNSYRTFRETEAGAYAMLSIEFNFQHELPLKLQGVPVVYRARIYDGHIFSSYAVYPDPEVFSELIEQQLLDRKNVVWNVSYYPDHVIFEINPLSQFVYPEPQLNIRFDNGKMDILQPIHSKYGHYWYKYHTDISKTGLGSIACQQDDGVRRSEFVLGSMLFTPVVPGNTAKLVCGNYTLSMGSDTAYEPFHVYGRMRPEIKSKVLPMIVPACEFLPDGIPLKGSPLLEVNVLTRTRDSGFSPNKLGIYAYNESSDAWIFLDNTISRDEKFINAHVSSLSVFGVLLDDRKPEILETYPSGQSHVQAGEIIFHARVRDVGSGIDYRAISAFIDGKPVPMDYDPDRGRIFSLEKITLEQGVHRLKLQVQDFAQNGSEVKIVSFIAD